MKTLSNVTAFNNKNGKLTLKTAVSNQIKEQEMAQIESAIINLDFQSVDNKNIFLKEYEDSNGNTFYATLTLSVSALHPNDKATKTSKPKANGKKDVVIIYNHDIDEDITETE